MIVSGTPEYEEWLHGRKAEGGRRGGRAHRGKKQSPEHVAKRVASLTGRKHSPERIAKTHTPESNAKRSAAMTGRKQSLEHVAKRVAGWKETCQEHPEKWRNAYSSETIARKVAGYKKTYQEHPERWKRSPESNAKQSRTMSQGILEGRICTEGHGIRGDFWSEKNQKKLHYRSQLELSWYQVLEAQEKVKSYEVEPLAIPYLWNGSVHLYHPDLMIIYTDFTLELVEIKPESEWDRKDSRNQAKWTAARSWCEESGRKIVFRVWGYKGLGS